MCLVVEFDKDAPVADPDPAIEAAHVAARRWGRSLPSAREPLTSGLRCQSELESLDARLASGTHVQLAKDGRDVMMDRLLG